MSILLGDQAVSLSKELVKSYQNMGLIHLLVVSGSQISLVSGVIWTCLRLVLWNQWLLLMVMGSVHFLMATMTGYGVSICRSILMWELVCCFSLFQRSVSMWHIVSAVWGVMVCINPMIVWDLGAQLSFLITISMIYGVPYISSTWLSSLPQWLAQLLSAVIAPSLVTIPLICIYFNRLNLLSIFGNLAVVPILETVVVLGFWGVIISQMVPTLGLLFHFISGQALKGVTSFVALESHLSGLIINIPQRVIVWWVIIFGLCVIGAIGFRSFRQSGKRWGVFSVACVGTALLWVWPSRYLTVTFLDVGQGDSAIIQLPNRQTVLIDAGPVIKDFRTGEPILDFGERIVEPALRSMGVNHLAAVIVSHYDNDHIGGIPYILSKFRIGLVIDHGYQRKLAGEYQDIIYSQNLRAQSVQKLSHLDFYSRVGFQFLHPRNSHLAVSENNRSVVLKIYFKDRSFLFTGDIDETVELQLLRNFGKALNSDILKVGHHGSKTSTSSLFLKWVDPLIAVCSVGRNNRYGHPHPMVVNRIKRMGISMFRTDRDGAVSIRSDGERLWIKTGQTTRSSWTIFAK